MTSNLYSLVKKLYQQKGKKLKIISDIREVINPFIASACYGLSDKKSIFTFKQYWKGFCEYDVGKTDKLNSVFRPELNLAKSKLEMKEIIKKHMGNWDYLADSSN